MWDLAGFHGPELPLDPSGARLTVCQPCKKRDGAFQSCPECFGTGLVWGAKENKNRPEAFAYRERKKAAERAELEKREAEKRAAEERKKAAQRAAWEKLPRTSCEKHGRVEVDPTLPAGSCWRCAGEAQAEAVNEGRRASSLA